MTLRRSPQPGGSRRALAAVVALAALLLGSAAAALTATTAAAVVPVASEPRARQELSQVPGSVTLAFDRDVDPSIAKVVVLGPNGKNVTSGTLLVEGTNVTIQLAGGLPRGTYTVRYRISASNGEPEGGAYQFSYGSGDFTTLPDRSWKGEDEEPAVLRGTDPNGPEQSEAPTRTATPGIEVTSQAPSSDSRPPATDPPSTVKAPSGPATEAGSGAATSVSATPAAQGGGGGTPWIVGGGLLLLAVGGTIFGLWHSKKEKAGGAGHE